MAGIAAGQAGFRDPKVLLPFLLITLIWSSTWSYKGQRAWFAGLGGLPASEAPARV